MSTKYKRISFGKKKPHKVINIGASRKADEYTGQIQWLWLHVKSAVWLKADRLVTYQHYFD